MRKRCLRIFGFGRPAVLAASFSWTAAVVAAAPQLEPTGPPAAQQPRTPLPIEPEAIPSEPPSNVRDAGDEVLAEAMVHFIVGFYLTGEKLSASQIAELYAAKVDYNGEPKVRREVIVREKLDYVKLWPKRRFDVVPNSIEVVRGAREPNFIDVVFEYTFELRAGKRVSRGRGSASLTFDFTTPHGRIVREDSKIVLTK